MVVWLFLAVPWVCLRLVIVVVLDHTHYIVGKICLSYDAASGSEITPCNKIDKPQEVYRFLGNVMTPIATLCT